MFTIPWLQISGALAGGIVGGFSGFVANISLDVMNRRRAMRGISCALIGEIEALTSNIEQNYLSMLRVEFHDYSTMNSSPRHHFRGDRDYMTIFHSLGGNIGYLPSPLPRDLVSWYTAFAAGLERAHLLHELTRAGKPEQMPYAIEIARIQLETFTDLVERAGPLLERLGKL